MNLEPVSRPYGLISVMVLLMIYNIGAVVSAWQLRDIVSSNAVWLHIVGSVFWIGVFIWVTSSLWRGERSKHRALMLIIAFALYNIVRLGVFTQAEYDRQRLPFVLVMTILIVIGLLMLRLILAEDKVTKDRDYDSKS